MPTTLQPPEDLDREFLWAGSRPQTTLSGCTGSGDAPFVTRSETWRSKISVTQSYASPVHAFDSEQRLLAILNNTPYIPDAPGDALTLDAHDYDRWFLLTLLGKPRHEDKKASKERNTKCAKTRTVNPKTGRNCAGRGMTRSSTIAPQYGTAWPIGVDDDDAKPVVSSASDPPLAPGIRSGLSGIAASDSHLHC
ncbi:hypothetical protein EV421DRAFT_2023595 [Armillaria borealis]|uniref:Uncharacterized protein n=1 Tax=Armillaria borealis TaxID=47425 RepID=A0AA39MGV8_9AGAR|nr:hypothetical protein EV421DRAFT_2023595 [Armillaria borealis]